MWNSCSTAFWVKLLDEDVLFITVAFFDLEGIQIGSFYGDYVGPEGSWWDLEYFADDLGPGFCGRLELRTHEDVDLHEGPLYKPVRVEVVTACDCL